MAPDGRKVRQLTRHDASDMQPAWSPDGSEIAFVSDRRGSSELFRMRTDGSRVRRVTHEEGSVFMASWSPDGRRIAYGAQEAGDYEIFSIRPDGTGRRNLTDSVGLDGLGDWSPDGSRIAFHSARFGPTVLFTMRPDGSDPRWIPSDGPGEMRTVPGGNRLFPMWTRNGGRILFQELVDGDFEIYSVRPGGTNVRQLTDNAKQDRLVWD
jgi:Tol biopolymer transport system component